MQKLYVWRNISEHATSDNNFKTYRMFSLTVIIMFYNKNRCFLMNILCFNVFEKQSHTTSICTQMWFFLKAMLIGLLLTWISFVQVRCTVWGFPNFISFLSNIAWFLKKSVSKTFLMFSYVLKVCVNIQQLLPCQCHSQWYMVANKIKSNRS